MSTNAVSKEAARLLRKVEKAILDEPKRFIMRDLASVCIVSDGNDPKAFASCKTAACIAGWTTILHHTSKDFKKFVENSSPEDYWEEAMELLELTHRQANDLFGPENWPEPFNSQFDWEADHDTDGRVRRKNAKVAVARIEHFIKTGE